MQEDRKDRLRQILRTKREGEFEEAWNATSSKYSRTREITEFIRDHGTHPIGLLPLPNMELADLIKLLSKEFYLGAEAERLGKGKSIVEKYIVSHGHDLAHFYEWCKESGINSDGQFLGLLRDVWGVLKDRHFDQ